MPLPPYPPRSFGSPHPGLFRFGEFKQWSTFKLPAGHNGNTNLKLFITQKGACGQGFGKEPLTKVDTNMLISQGTHTPVDVHRVVWEVFGGTGPDHHAVWRSGVWSWSFLQTVIDGSPLSTISQTHFGRESGSTECSGCGASLPPTRKCGYCDHLNGGAQGMTMFGALEYTTHPLSIPSHSEYAIQLDLCGTLELASPVQIRFTLDGKYQNAIEIG